MRIAVLLAAVLGVGTLGGCAFVADKTPATLAALPPGSYKLEKDHGSLVFRVKHLGLSHYTARIAGFDATLEFDPSAPAASRVSAMIDPMSVRTDHPTDKDWDRRLGADLLKGETHPQITFNSTTVAQTGALSGVVTGDLTLGGVTRPVTLEVTYNGGMEAAALYSGRAAVGFSAKATLKRSDFGLTRYAAFVGDEVEVIIEAEFTRR